MVISVTYAPWTRSVQVETIRRDALGTLRHSMEAMHRTAACDPEPRRPQAPSEYHAQGDVRVWGLGEPEQEDAPPCGAIPSRGAPGADPGANRWFL